MHLFSGAEILHRFIGCQECTTTHILKPAIADLDDHDINEHLCLRAAFLTGMRAAPSRILTFRGQRAICVERYDRIVTEDRAVVRVHQEDFCQALKSTRSASTRRTTGLG